MTTLIVIGAGLAVALILLWAGQRKLMYFPDTRSPSLPVGVEEVELSTEDGLVLQAWLVPPSGSGSALVVVFPGNAGNRAVRVPLARDLARHDLGVLLVEYRGFGGNPGAPSQEGLLADARAVGRWVEEHATGPVVYLGESLGAGLATYLATEVPPTALVLRSPFSSSADVAGAHFPYLPVRFFVRDPYPVAEWVTDVEVPVVVVVGSGDSIVPMELSRRVAEAAGAGLVVVEGADHNDPELASGPVLVDVVVRAAGQP